MFETLGTPASPSVTLTPNSTARIEEEIKAWAEIPANEIDTHMRTIKGFPVLDEFSLAFSQRLTMPLHFEVFRRCAPHKPHEGNVEGWFSTVKGLSQPSSHPEWTTTLARVAINNRTYKPPSKLLWRMYVKEYQTQKAPKEQEE